MTVPETLPQFWLEKVNQYRGTDKVAVRQKEFGIWRTFNWDEEYRQVRDLSLGMIALGLKPGDRVAIIGDNDRQYLWAAIAIMAARAAVVGIFTDVTAAEVQYVADHSDAVFAFASDQEQCDKWLEIKDQLPQLKHVIYWDDRGMWSYDDPWLIDFKRVQQIGREQVENAADEFETMIAAQQGDEPAMFCYTSGTTGLPKGAIISHTNFISVIQAYDQIDPRFDTDNYVSFLPLAWITGATLDIVPHVMFGIILNFAEKPETVRENIREIAPDGIVYNPGLWEGLVAAIQARMLDSIWLNRFLYQAFLPVGYHVADLQFEKKPIPFWYQLLYQLGRQLIFKPLLSQFGLHRARIALNGGSMLSPDVIRFFRALGLAVRQAYASTEVTAGATIHSRDDVRFETIGKPLDNVKLKISDQGEILISSPGLFLGYHKNPTETDKAVVVDDDGRRWFRTGDAGHIDDDGHVIYLERMKDLITLANGDKYSPQYIEGRLKFSPYISQAMTLGDESQDQVTALITIDFENVGRWAEKHRLVYTTYTDLSQKSEIYRLIRQDVERVNSTLPASARVRRFVLMHKEFDADEGEMTRTRKLRRGFLVERYETIISALYANRDAVEISATVAYQDGRTSIVNTKLHIEAIEQEAVAI